MKDIPEWAESLTVKDSPGLEALAQVASGDRDKLQVILDGLVVKDHVYRENCFKVVVVMCDRTPEALYPEWDTFEALLKSDNGFHRAIGVQVLARLCRVDETRRFEGLFDRYFELLDDGKVMVSRYLVQNVWRIVEAKPHLMQRITDKLLRIEETHHSESRQALLRADVLDAVDVFYDQIGDTGRVLAFAEVALGCSSPKARKRAKAFLEAHSA
jgi:hypothetical protein